LVVVVAGGGYFGWRYTQNQYYVGTNGGQIAIFRGVNQSVAGVQLFHVFRHTGIPVAQIPNTDQQSLQGTISASSLANAWQIVGRIRGDYQNCQDAYTALRTYNSQMSNYKNALRGYKQRYGTTNPVTKKGVHHTPPKPPKGPAPTIPSDCPAPANTAQGTQGSS
jgi:PPM family protein phosphatase